MADAIIIPENFAAHEDAVITCAQADSAYPVANLVDHRGASRCRMTAQAWEITVVLPYAREADFFGLLHVSSLGGTEVEASARPHSGESFSALATIQCAALQNPYSLLGSAQMLSEFKFTVSGGGSAAGGVVDPFEVVLGDAPDYPIIGELFIGKSVTLNRRYDIGDRIKTIWPSLEAQSLGLVERVYSLGSKRRVFTLPWGMMDEATQQQWLDALDLTQGPAKPFVFLPDGDGGAAYFVRGPGETELQSVFLKEGQETIVLSEQGMPHEVS